MVRRVEVRVVGLHDLRRNGLEIGVVTGVPGVAVEVHTVQRLQPDQAAQVDQDIVGVAEGIAEDGVAAATGQEVDVIELAGVEQLAQPDRRMTVGNTENVRAGVLAAQDVDAGMDNGRVARVPVAGVLRRRGLPGLERPGQGHDETRVRILRQGVIQPQPVAAQTGIVRVVGHDEQVDIARIQHRLDLHALLGVVPQRLGRTVAAPGEDHRLFVVGDTCLGGVKRHGLGEGPEKTVPHEQRLEAGAAERRFQVEFLLRVLQNRGEGLVALETRGVQATGRGIAATEAAVRLLPANEFETGRRLRDEGLVEIDVGDVDVAHLPRGAVDRAGHGGDAAAGRHGDLHLASAEDQGGEDAEAQMSECHDGVPG